MCVCGGGGGGGIKLYYSTHGGKDSPHCHLDLLLVHTQTKVTKDELQLVCVYVLKVLCVWRYIVRRYKACLRLVRGTLFIVE